MSTHHSEGRLKGKSLLEFPYSYVVIDLETTGLDPKNNHIIEVAALRITEDHEDGTFTSLINPHEALDPFITGLTGITQEMLSDAPSLETVLPRFLDFIGDSIVVGHNVNFDINFIYEASAALLHQPFSNDFVDTLRLSRRLYREETHHRLSDLIARFHIGDCVDHRAMSDVRQTNACLQHMKRYAATPGVSLSRQSRKKCRL